MASARTGIPYRSVTPRIGELKKGGWVRTVPGRTRRTSSGEKAEVLTLTQKGWEHAESYDAIAPPPPDDRDYGSGSLFETSPAEKMFDNH